MLTAAMNPCPCGYYGDDEKTCICAAHEILRYEKKISGPLLDRIDIQITVPRVKIKELREREINEDETKTIRAKVSAARLIQKNRLASRKKFTNSELSSKECDALIKLDSAGEQFVKEVFDKSLLSARGYYRVLKVAQTIADLENAPVVTVNHLAESFGYRVREKK